MTRLDEIIINSKVGREWLIKYIKENNPDLYNLVIQKQKDKFQCGICENTKNKELNT